MVEAVGQKKNETAEGTLNHILERWLKWMAVVTNNSKKKLLALALTSLMTADSTVVLAQIAPIVRNVVEVLNDITEVTETGEQIE